MQPMQIVQRVPNTENALVFGMQWRTHVGVKADRAAPKEARKAKATHYAVTSDKGSVAVGITTLQGKLERGVTLHSAAAVLAQLHKHETVIVWQSVGESRVWVVAAQKGVVVARTDVIYEQEEEAAQKVKELQERFKGGVQLLGNMPGAAQLDLVAMLNATSEQTKLRLAAVRWSNLTPANKAVFAMAAIAPVLYLGWTYWQDYQYEQALAARQSIVIDREAEWAKQIESFRKTTLVHPESTIVAIQDHLFHVPLDVGRWKLQSAECSPVGATWNCRVSYSRASSLATNQSFLQHKPADWEQVNFTTLDLIQASWSVELPQAELDLDGLPNKEALDVKTISAWQSVLPVLSSINLGEPTITEIPSPVVTHPDGRPEVVPKIAGIPQIVKRAIAVEAPLRSLAVVPFSSTQVAVQSIKFRVLPDAEPSINRSVLSAEISGVLYAKN